MSTLCFSPIVVHSVTARAGRTGIVSAYDRTTPSRNTSKRCSTITRVTADDFDPAQVEFDVFERMEKTIDAVREKFNTVRTGRASPKILDRINVEYYGTLTPLNTIANASTPDSQTIVIQPFDKTCINDIERAIMLSDLGLNPSNDGTCIRLSIPPLTAERRKELAKLVSKLGEDGKVALRNVRRDAIKSMGKIEGVSQDNVKSIEVAIDALTSDFVKKVDELVRQKEVDISKV